MPISYLNFSDPTKMEITNWLLWTDQDFKKIVDGKTFIAALMGITCSGSVQPCTSRFLLKMTKMKPLHLLAMRVKINQNPFSFPLTLTQLETST